MVDNPKINANLKKALAARKLKLAQGLKQGSSKPRRHDPKCTMTQFWDQVQAVAKEDGVKLSIPDLKVVLDCVWKIVFKVMVEHKRLVIPELFSISPRLRKGRFSTEPHWGAHLKLSKELRLTMDR